MQERSRKIAKNTMFLYIRTFIVLVVGLFTGRVLLEALGIDNYGIYNVVAGIVSFITVLTVAMSAASSRYIAFTLGENKPEKLKEVFRTIFYTHLIMAITIVIVLEIAGVWFLNAIANIPADRMRAANWVLQCSILITFISIVYVPYHASIIAHEHFKLIAYTSILDVSLKLAICYLLMEFGGDRLILYSSLMLAVSILTTPIYIIYCHKHFEEVNYSRDIKKSMLKEIAAFSGWNLLDSTSSIFCTQGINILINIFFGVVYNAARGICVTVNSCIQAFVGNVAHAMNPQITKSYAAGEYDYCFSLANRCMKFMWLILLVFMVPVCTESFTLLHLWLVDVPPMAVLFLQFTMFETLAAKSGIIFQTLIQANGNIKRYTLQTSLFTLLTFPLTWLAYRLGAPAWIAYPIYIVIFFASNFIRIHNINRIMNYGWKTYFVDVLRPCVLTTIISFIAPVIITHFWHHSLLRFFIMVPFCVLNTALISYFFALNRSEKEFINDKIRKIVEKTFFSNLFPKKVHL